jgi:hypothetical protein
VLLEMAAAPIQLQEPESFASGDTIWFELYLADYLPSAGWSLKYTLTSLDGKEVAAVQSVVSDSNPNRHKIYQQNFAAGLDAYDYIFTGELLNSITGDRKQSYKAVLTIGPDLQDGLASQPLISENVQALQDAYATRRELIKRKFTETEDLRSRFILQKLSEINNLIKELEEKVIWEKRAARAANGEPDGSTTSPVLRVFC